MIWRRLGGLGALLAALVLTAALASVASAASAWSRPFQLTSPVALNITPAQVAFSPAGAASIGYSLVDDQQPGTATAWVVSRPAHGRTGQPVQLTGAARVLALNAGGGALDLLAGISDPAKSCCAQVWAVGPGRGASLGPQRVLLSSLSGSTEARLVNVGSRLLAVVATERGVWTSQSGAGGSPFGAVHRLSGASQLPQSLDAVFAAGKSLVAWTARTGSPTADGPRLVYVAQGDAGRAPQRERLALKVPASHEVDELALAAGPRAPTLAWVESWYDARGGFHSQVKVADVTSRLHLRTVSAQGEVASGISLAADARGDQALSWEVCTAVGNCAVRAALRSGARTFGQPQRLAGIDASDAPAAMVTSGGEAVIAWIQNGHVRAARGSGAVVGPPTTVSSTGYAADLRLASSPRGGGLAVWTQGTLNESLHAAALQR